MKRAGSHIKVVVLILITTCVIVAGIMISRTKWDFHLVTYKSQDMEPIIAKNETLIVKYEVENIRRGDIVIFIYPADHSQRFIKRVVGLPGEVVSIREGRVFIDEKPLDESYLKGELNTSRRIAPDYRIPLGTYYVLGDNRDASNDSRFWGALSAELIYGKVMFK